jgi:transposase
MEFGKKPSFLRGAIHMFRITTIGVDLAKSSFTVCGLNSAGDQVLRKEFRREAFATFIANLEPCKIFMEACGSSNFWARRATAAGHDVKLIAPQKVLGFRKCNKNDRNDAHAICVAGLCPGIEFVPIKSVSQQDIQSIIRVRARLIQRQTSLVNEMRGLLAEYGLVVPEGISFIRAKLSEISELENKVIDQKKPEFSELTTVIMACARSANEELIDITNRIEAHEKMLLELTKSDERCARIQSIPGVGPITAATVVASVSNPNAFKNGRQFAASVGLTPKHVQTGGKDSKPIQLGISKHGDSILRSLLVQGGMTVAAACKSRQEKSNKILKSSSIEPNDSGEKKSKRNATIHPFHGRTKKKSEKKLLSPHREEWVRRLINEKGMQKTAVAIANHNARIILSLLKSGGTYNLDNEGQRSTSVAQ